MPVTQSQIDSASTALAVQKLQTTISNESSAAITADIARVATDRAAELAAQAVIKTSAEVQANALASSAASLVRQEATLVRQAVALEAAAAAAQDQAAVASAATLNSGQLALLMLVESALKVRLGPSQIVAATSDAVLQDMAEDACKMGQRMFDVLAPKLESLS